MVSTDEAPASRSVLTSSQMLTADALTLAVGLLRAIRAVRRRLPSASGAKSQRAWVSPSGHSRQDFTRVCSVRYLYGCRTELT